MMKEVKVKTAAKKMVEAKDPSNHCCWRNCWRNCCPPNMPNGGPKGIPR